ncbi:nucleoside 2-deoxyribosyltransferase [Candidatus Pacearchaeota archaeon]|nr:nucleoside 2-deoxyribosyltransferase [Candidatus Pacearchaeota archaeon]|tara:strand:- start:144 stop:551 length:408 start_codon:yes stop_codon:yes gene_type:complete
MVKVYLAGPLCTEENREFLEKLDKLCKEFEFETFLPHRDAGLFKDIKDVPEISKKDVEELHECDVLIGVLDGICVGAGTAWEIGYFQALGKKVIGLKTDRKVSESISDISAVIAGQVKIVESLEELSEELGKIKD